MLCLDDDDDDEAAAAEERRRGGWWGGRCSGLLRRRRRRRTKSCGKACVFPVTKEENEGGEEWVDACLLACLHRERDTRRW